MVLFNKSPGVTKSAFIAGLLSLLLIIFCIDCSSISQSRRGIFDEDILGPSGYTHDHIILAYFSYGFVNILDPELFNDFVQQFDSSSIGSIVEIEDYMSNLSDYTVHEFRIDSLQIQLFKQDSLVSYSWGKEIFEDSFNNPSGENVDIETEINYRVDLEKEDLTKSERAVIENPVIIRLYYKKPKAKMVRMNLRIKGDFMHTGVAENSEVLVYISYSLINNESGLINAGSNSIMIKYSNKNGFWDITNVDKTGSELLRLDK